MPGPLDDEMESLVITDELVYFYRKNKNQVRIFPRKEGFCYAEVLRIPRPLSFEGIYLYLRLKYLDRPAVQIFLHRDYWETLSEWLESIGCNTCLASGHLEAINTDNIAHASLDGSNTVMIEWKDETRDLFDSKLVSQYKIPVTGEDSDGNDQIW